VTYFAPVCRQALRERGLKGFWAGYFAGRAAPLGSVGAGPATAAFFNFHPHMVQAAVPHCWDVVDPAEVVVLRALAASVALRELCPADALDALLGSLSRLREAASHCDGAGRIMTGANRAVWAAVVPGLRSRHLGEDDQAVAEAWQCCTTLREHRGDGHVAALVAHGLDGVGAHLLAVAALGVPAEVLRDNRGWSEAEWEGAAGRLVDMGLLEPHATASATSQGLVVHRSLEALTDRLAESPYATLSDGAVSGLHGALVGCARAIQSSGLYPFPNPMGLPRLPDEVEALGAAEG